MLFRSRQFLIVKMSEKEYKREDIKDLFDLYCRKSIKKLVEVESYNVETICTNVLKISSGKRLGKSGKKHVRISKDEKLSAILIKAYFMVAFLLFVYFLVHTWATHAMQSREFYLSISYFALYAVFRVIKGMRLTNYAALAVLLCGIYQSYLVLEQLLGYEASNHSRFVVTGSFFNPGPCGIFLAGVFEIGRAHV